MDDIKVYDYLDQLIEEKKVAKCVVTRFKVHIYEMFPSAEEFSKATKSDILSKYVLSLKMKAHKNNIEIPPKPYIGAELYGLCETVRRFIVEEALQLKKAEAEDRRLHEIAIANEKKRNPIFTVGALKSIVALAELAGRDTVNLDECFAFCKAFGVDLGPAE